MIVNFSIQNFGSVKDKQILSFEADKSTHLEDYYVIQASGGLRLLKLALIYGANASGKTTILKALEFLRDIVLNPEKKKTDPLDFSPFLFDTHTASQNTILSIEFLQNDRRYFYEVEFNKKAVAREELNVYDPNKANVFKRTTDMDKQLSVISYGSKIKKDKTVEKTLELNTLWNNTVLGAFLKTNIEFKELKDASDWFSNYLQSLIFAETNLENYITPRISSSEINKKDVVNILKKADFNISDILMNETEEEIPNGFIEFLERQMKFSLNNLDRVKNTKNIGKIISVDVEFERLINNEKYSLPFDLESQGAKRYFGLAGVLSLLINKSMAFPIDELESSLHPDLFVHFLLSFLVNSKRSQIISTMHNREILNNKDIFRNDVIWFTDKTDHCSTELYSLSDFDSKVIRDSTNVFNAYKIGKLGGIPTLGDYYLEFSNEKN